MEGKRWRFAMAKGQAMNSTIMKFGWPQSCVREYAHWIVLVRPAQPTLGSLVLAAKSEATEYGALAPEAYVEQGQVVADIERALSAFVDYDRINYLMLMMVDPHVHFHVIPRYEGQRTWDGFQVADRGWPGPPALSEYLTLDGEQLSLMAAAIKQQFKLI